MTINTRSGSISYPVDVINMADYTLDDLFTIRDNFRVYDSMDEGVKGYFEFIQLVRYQNLRGITDPEEYLKTIKADGYATDSKYVEKNMQIIRQYGLTKYDAAEGSGEEKVMAKTAETLIAQAIAKKYGTTVSAIQKLNVSLIKNVNVIQTGWKIRVK